MRQADFTPKGRKLLTAICNEFGVDVTVTVWNALIYTAETIDADKPNRFGTLTRDTLKELTYFRSSNG